MNSFAQATGWAWLAHPDGGRLWFVGGRAGMPPTPGRWGNGRTDLGVRWRDRGGGLRHPGGRTKLGPPPAISLRSWRTCGAGWP